VPRNRRIRRRRRAPSSRITVAVKVADPYRWLEDAADPETVKWVEAENALTRSYLDGPRRDAIKARLTELLDFPRVSVPEKQGTRYFFTRNSGLQNQSVLYVREGLEGQERILLDPNALSADGTVALTGTAPTQDGALLGYSLSRSGSDRQEIYVRDVATGKDLPDKVLAKFTAIVWTPDKAGFYYTRFPAAGIGARRATRTTSRRSTSIRLGDWPRTRTRSSSRTRPRRRSSGART
jgi:prolyl oligopeptidase